MKTDLHNNKYHIKIRLHESYLSYLKAFYQTKNSLMVKCKAKSYYTITSRFLTFKTFTGHVIRLDLKLF